MCVWTILSLYGFGHRGTVYLLHCRPIDVDGDVLTSPTFPVVHDQLLGLSDIEREAVAPASHCQVTDHLPVG